MTEALVNLFPLLEKLSDEECAEVVGYLLDRISPPDGIALDDDAFLEELDRRRRQIDDGTARAIPAEEVFRELRRKYP